MYKKTLFITILILIISFSAGIFTEIAVSEGRADVPVLPAAGAALFDYIKNDFLTVFAALLFSASVFLAPLVPLMIIGKTFSLGFSAAYILSSASDQALRILVTVLFPRGIFKLPAYLALVLISAEAAAFVRENYQNPAALKRGVLRHIRRFLLCFLALAASSVPEAFLLSGVLSP